MGIMSRNKTKDITLNQKEMLEYFKEFDPIAKKYQKYFNCCQTKDHSEVYRECYEYEYNRWLPDLTKKEYGDVYANLKLVYEDQEKIMEILDIYELVYEKVIVQYLNIDGMERLFSEKYINFEWEMHLGIDYSEHAMKYYRDHFIHQVRDAYFMDILLQEGYAGKVRRILGNPGNSKISQYVCKLLGQQLERGHGIMKISKEDMLREYYLDNIIYMSSYMSALFHDIGYPEVANMQSGRNILGYIANVYSFGSGHVEFDRIISVLQNTLLFRVVSPNEIRERIEREKIDHGAVSSLMFLLHFYENGAIYGLEPYKRCAVEIAGLAIYNHTNSYAYIKGKPGRHYYRNVFTLNPISYLLRICDDMQEWGRIYFEISPNANIIVCNKLCNKLQGLWENFQGNTDTNTNTDTDTNFSKDALLLMKDCCLQASRLYLDLDGYDFYPDRYFEQFNAESDIVPCCVRFAHSDNYQPMNQRVDAERCQLDAYTDLYLFRALLRKIDL